MSQRRTKVSHLCDSLCRTRATALSHPRDTGSSYKKSYSLLSCGYPASDPLEQITGEVEIETSASRTRTHRSGRFLKGPILLKPIAQAAGLPGKALALYLAVHHRSDLKGQSTVTLPASLLQQFGIDRDAKARGLRALENAALIQVERNGRRAARIALIREVISA